MDLGIKGKNALVTGGSRGLGKHAALSLAREGVNVAICGRTQETLDKTVKELEGFGVSSMSVIATWGMCLASSRCTSRSLTAWGLSTSS